MQNPRLELIFQVTSYLISLGNACTQATCTQSDSTVSPTASFVFQRKIFKLTRSYHFRYTISLYQCDNYIIENNYRYIKPDGIEFYFRNFQSRLQQRSTIFTIRFIYWLKKLFFPLLVKNHFTYAPSCNDKPRRYLQSRRFTTRDFRSSKSNPIIIAFFQARQNQLCSFLPLVSPTFEGQRLAP